MWGSGGEAKFTRESLQGWACVRGMRKKLEVMMAMTTTLKDLRFSGGMSAMIPRGLAANDEDSSPPAQRPGIVYRALLQYTDCVTIQRGRVRDSKRKIGKKAER